MKWPEGVPVGEVTRLAQSPPRPALRLLSDSVPLSLVKGLRSGRELARARRDLDGGAPLATGVEAFDRLLKGGLPRGQLVEVFGHRASGRFSAVLGILAAVTGTGEAAALVDLGDGLDPASAQRAGVDLARLLWLRPTRLKDALHGAEMVLSTGFPLVAVDLGYPPLKGSSRMATAWLRLARAAQKQQAALLVASPYRITGAAASVVLRGRRGRPHWTGRDSALPLLEGLEGRWVLEKCRGRRPGEEQPLQLLLEPLPVPESRPAPAADATRTATSADARGPRPVPPGSSPSEPFPEKLRAVAG
ncbi:MAG: hypothetical protein KDD47_27215 [Acidobacteria bacterium]|nr:hypothetical protein [Acidobacteriota bacterium]